MLMITTTTNSSTKVKAEGGRRTGEGGRVMGDGRALRPMM